MDNRRTKQRRASVGFVGTEARRTRQDTANTHSKVTNQEPGIPEMRLISNHKKDLMVTDYNKINYIILFVFNLVHEDVAYITIFTSVMPIRVTWTHGGIDWRCNKNCVVHSPLSE